MQKPAARCTSGAPQSSSPSLPYSTLQVLGGQGPGEACGAWLSFLNGALVCPRCDLLPTERVEA